MRENDIIAEYVKKSFPEILNTTDFALFKLSITCRKFILEDIKKSFPNIDFGENKESEDIE